MIDIAETLKIFINRDISKIVMSNSKASGIEKEAIIRTSKGYQSTKYMGEKVFHKTIGIGQLIPYISETMAEEGFQQLNAWDSEIEYIVRITNKGKLLFSKSKSSAAPKEQLSHNREKNYIFKEGMVIPPLIDMGIFTTQGKVVASMYDKFKQINRFIELIDDEIKDIPEGKGFNMIDFGCGKSYLTFLMYYYFTEIKKIDVKIIGIDLKESVVEKCNLSARKYNYKNLHFICGDIKDFKEEIDINMVITLHACDTATDYALFNAICLNADIIFSVPCCQHEINSQISTDGNLAFVLKYGIMKERFSAILTDTIRANLLEASGYRTQIVEFIDMEHTPKNLMIRAHKTNISQEKKNEALRNVESVMGEFNITPTLYSLMKGSNDCHQI